MLLKGIVLLLCMFSAFPYPCEHIQEKESIQKIINHIKERTNISSVWCKGNVSHDFSLVGDEVDAMLKNIKIIEIDESFDFEIAFTCDKKNFYYLVYNQKTLKPLQWDFLNETKKEKPKQESSSPVFNIIKKTIEEKSQKLYQQNASIKKQGKVIYFNDAAYMKDGKTIGLYISEDGKEVYNISSDLNKMMEMTDMTPLNMAGMVGPGTEDNKISTWGISLAEFLDLPGPFHLHYEGEYTILWHRANYFEDSLGREIPLSLDIWIDQNGDIRRIDYVEYYGRIWEPEDFQKCRYEGIINCMTPKWIEKSYFFNDYTVVSEGIRFPLKGREEEYYVDTKTPEGFQFIADKRKGIFSREEFLLKRCFMPYIVERYKEFSINPESLKVNEPIPEDVFTAPPITERKAIVSHSEKNQLWNIPIRAIVFVGVGVLIVLVLMYLTHRYLGWSFF